MEAKRHTARECWEYVNGPASRLEGCTPGVRDVDNDGKTPEDFLREANTFIRTRRWRLAALMNQISDGGAPSSQPGSPDGPVRQQSMMADEHALLTRDEVLAVRLYSGPAFQPLNSFLTADLDTQWSGAFGSREPSWAHLCRDCRSRLLGDTKACGRCDA